MNAYCKRGNRTDETNFFYKFSYLHDDGPQDELRTLTTSVDCESTSVLHSMENPVYPVPLGLSKHCCWLCEKFIKAFQALHKPEKKFFVSDGFQGKIHSGWSLPPNTPAEVQTSIEELFENKLDEIREELEGRRHSDQ